jgi:hypothetical protein
LAGFAPVSQYLEVWVTPGDYSDTSVTHCAQTSSYTYQYSSSFSYSPVGCVSLPRGELVEKTASDVLITTMIDDEFVQTAPDGGPACSSLQTTCTTGTFNTASGLCTCTKKSTTFTQNPEESVLHFNHGYQVTETTSNEVTYGRDKAKLKRDDGAGNVKTISGQEGEMLTVITRPDGTECPVGGKAHWQRSDVGEGVTGSLKEWFACAGKSLDGEFPELGSGVAGESGIPKLRVTGSVLNLEMNYYNHNARTVYRDFEGVVCVIKVSVLPQWSTWYRMGYSSVPDAQTGVGSYRYRQNHGIDVKFQSAGAFRFVQYTAVITALVNALVILGLPNMIITFVAAYGIGLVSRIYYKAMNQPLNILRLSAGLVSRLIVGVESFKTLTQSEDLTTGFTHDKLAARMRDAFKKDMDEGQLSQKEVSVLAQVVQSKMDLENSGEITLKEFLVSLTSQEPMDHEDIASLFDVDRKPCFTEALLSDSRLNVIRKMHRNSGNSETPGNSNPEISVTSSNEDISEI